MNFSYMVVRAMRDDWAYSRQDGSNWHPRGRASTLYTARFSSFEQHRNRNHDDVDERGLQPQAAELLTFFNGADAQAVAENYAAELASHHPQYDFFVVKSLVCYSAKPSAATKTTFTDAGAIPSP